MEQDAEPPAGGVNSQYSEPRPWLGHYGHPSAWQSAYPPLSLPDLFLTSVAAFGRRPLVDFLGRRYTYAELAGEAHLFAAGLQRLGVGKGDRVGLFLPNVPIYVPAYYGALIAGATVVNFSPLYTPEELAAQVADSGTRLMVTIDSASLLPVALEVLRESGLERLIVGRLADMLPRVKGWALRLLGRSQLTPVPDRAEILPWARIVTPGTPRPVALDPERDVALLQYTGGTTGTPKGAMLTHQNLTANARQTAAIDPHRGEGDTVLGALPLFHVFANTCVLNRTVLVGGCVAMLPRFDAGQVLATLQRVRATQMPGVPTMFQALLDHPRLARTDFSSLRACISGGAPLSEEVRRAFEAATGARLMEGYGLTEVAGVVSANPYESECRAGTIGQPVPGTRVRLLDKDDPARDAPPGEPGELAVLGPQVMAGYWNRPEASTDVFVSRGQEVWLRTGDIAMLDDDGYIRIVDRIKDMISVGGFKVYPSAIETVLLHHPAVREAMVISVPDTYHGEMPRAFVSLHDQGAGSIDTAGLRDWLNARVGKHERVDAVVVLPALPKTMVGKLDRKALRRMIAAGEA